MDNSGGTEWSSVARNSLDDPFSNIAISNIDIGRESIPFLDLSTSFGRESLGILKLECGLDSINQARQNYSFSNISEDSHQNVLNQAFILSRKTLDFKSASTVSMKSSNFSFNIRDFDQPSVIRPLDSFNSIHIRESINNLNEGFLYTTGLSNSPLAEYRSRFHSLPVYTSKNEIDSEYLIKQVMNRVSEGCQKLNCSILKENVAEEDTFNDSVFIEARHLTAKFSEEGSNDGFILDETDPPELINGELEESKCDNKCDSEEIFKRIDKLLPADGYQKLNEKLDNRSTECSKQSPSQIPHTEYVSTNIEKEKQKDFIEETDSMMNIALPIEYNRSNMEKSKEILNTLSQILANENRSEKETEEGQNLLNTLSNILGDRSQERSKSFTDKSIKSNNGTGYMNVSSIRSEDSSQNNQSTSSKIVTGETMLRRHSNSFSHPTRALRSKLATSLGRSPSFDLSKNKSSVSSASECSVEVKNFSADTALLNLKVKKVSSAQARRGPLKATVPLENFTKPRVKETTPKTQVKLPKLTSRISTPIREVQLRPMAQSTPDNKIDNRSSLEQPNIRSFSSPNLQEKSTNYSSSANSLSSHKDFSNSKDRSSLQQSHLPRRNSVSETRRSSISSELKRSNSLKETSLMKTMNRIRQNLSGSTGLPKKAALRDCSNVSPNNGSSSSGKFTATPRRMMRTVGKENVS